MAARPIPEGPIKPAPAPPKRGGISVITLLIVVLLASAISGGATWFLFGRKVSPVANADAAETHADARADGRDGKPGDPKKPGQAQYLALDPAFVVNTADEDSQHYLQTDVQVMARNDLALDAVKTHMPRIRNNLLMLFAQQKTADIRDRAGRERLRAAALKEVQDVLQAETGKPGVEALYFTSFVTQ